MSRRFGPDIPETLEDACLILWPHVWGEATAA